MFSFRTVNDFLYLVGMLNAGNLAGNQYLNFALIAFTEMPSAVIGEAMMNHLGRRWSNVLCLLFSTILYAAIIPMTSDVNLGTAVTALAIISKISSNIGFFVVCVQAVEVFPTSVRCTGRNVAAIIATILAIGAPYLTLMVGIYLPSVTAHPVQYI